MEIKSAILKGKALPVFYIWTLFIFPLFNRGYTKIYDLQKKYISKII